MFRRSRTIAATALITIALSGVTAPASHASVAAPAVLSSPSTLAAIKFIGSAASTVSSGWKILAMLAEKSPEMLPKEVREFFQNQK